MTSPRLVVFASIETKLNELYHELVGDEEAEQSLIRKGYSFPPRVAEIFAHLEAAGKVWRPRKIIVPETKRELEIPLAYKNGKINYVLPLSLAPIDSPESRLPKMGFNGLLIHQHKIDNEAGQLVVMSYDEMASGEMERRFAEVLDDFHVRFVPYAQTLAFAEEVEKTAH